MVEGEQDLGPLIVGILNVTPDSFSDGGRFKTTASAVEAGEQLISDGADIIEVGGESTRPGSASVPLTEEIHRVLPLVKELMRRFSVPISVDTSKAEVARLALEEGVDYINDVTAMQGDPEMAPVLGNYGCRIVLMHMKGTPRNMQQNPFYDDVVKEISGFFRKRISFAGENGIGRERLILDPGIGFGKRVSDNLCLLRDLKQFQSLECPIMIGVSRKSFIGKVTGKTVSEREFGTCAANFFAVLNGAKYIRVHNVSAANDLLRIFSSVQKGSIDFDND